MKTYKIQFDAELRGADQVGELARLLLDSTPERNAARRRAEREAREEVALARRAGGEPEAPLFSFDRFVMPVIASCAADSIMDHLVGIQPMCSPAGAPVIKFEVVHAGQLERERDGYEAALRAMLAPGEELHAYRYGGVLPERGGYFVTHRDAPDRVLRYVQTMMS